MPNKSSKQTQKEESVLSRTKLPGHYSLWEHVVFYSFTTTKDHHRQTSKNTSLRSNLRVFLDRKFCFSMYSWLTAGLGGPVPVVVLEDSHSFCLRKQFIGRSRTSKSQKSPNTNGATLLRGLLMTKQIPQKLHSNKGLTKQKVLTKANTCTG